MGKKFYVILALICLSSYPFFSQEIAARWGLDSVDSVVGQRITLTLEVQGADQLDEPKLAVPNVDIIFQGGGPRNSTSIVSVNGKTTKTVRKSWVGSWSLKAVSVGTYHISPQNITIGGKSITLNALDWQVSEARSDNRFVLQQRLSQNTCIPGIEIEYTLVWYIGQSVENPEFTIPILDNPDLVPVETSFTGASGDTFQLKYKGRVLTGVKEIVQQGGEQFTSLTIRFKVKPTKPGVYDLGGTMVSFDGSVDTQTGQDLFGNLINQPVYRTLVSKAQALTLVVKDLPVQGKPDPFSGLIGKLNLSWEGGEGSYSVGDPIRLTLSLSGVLNKPNLDLDHMVISALNTADFQVSSDPSAKEQEGKRSFIVRPRKSGKLQIPSLSLNYYNSETERYAETATKPLVFDIAGFSSSPGAPSAEKSELPNPILPQPKLAFMNPNGFKYSFWPSVPWWSFSFPGLFAGLVLSLCSLWKYSLVRITALERKKWIKILGPLDENCGRLALEEGRTKLYRLVNAGVNWKKKLQADGRWEILLQHILFWDEAFFADSRDDEPWNDRWETLRVMMEAWK